ncbi:metallophosphoesterase family protein [Bifidobacterium sp. ESL0745]|uniref:metallophosphoesterase family protein n=1 Tax=Bifidobacterium sp. ESL0745 TaxID=2983226 RepID=UPI0023F89F2A|nr:metallophosphoesterase family protein [Bifidobacterium sp. ESL0745]MDF7666099.1 metallophosphoesterase family protein [Bifidobacterium sp. ESL0745]
MTELTRVAKDSADFASKPRIQPVHPGDTRPVSVSARLGRLQFHDSGKFRVLVLADIQDGPKISKDTIKLIEAALDSSRPDIVIFPGNQIAGYDKAYAKTFRKRTWTPQKWSMGAAATNQRDAELDHTRELVRGSISQFVSPLIERHIPWAVTYGNHDFQCGLTNAELDEIYREFPGCLNPEPMIKPSDRPRKQPGSGLPDQYIYPCEPGTFALPVSKDRESGNVLGLVVFNSGDYGKLGGYGAPSQRALDFLKTVPSLIGVQSMVFQHIPVPQYYDLLKEVPATAAHAVEGYRKFAGHNYVIDEAKTLPGSFLGEGISCPDTDTGEFDVLKSTDGYFALLAGHDHRNRFVGTVDGLTLIATPTCGFGSYGPAPAQRAARLLEFDIRHPYEPRTQLLEFGDLVGKSSSSKAYTYALNGTPDAAKEGTNLLRRPRLIAQILRKMHLKK